MTENSASYRISIGDLVIDLPIVSLSECKKIALLNLLGDVFACEVISNEFLKICDTEFDFIVTPEVKSIPLAHEFSRLTRRPYIVFRKLQKSYMASAIGEKVHPFTSEASAMLWIDGPDILRIKGKRIVIIDDVITTGSTIGAIERMVVHCGGQVVDKLVVLEEGSSSLRSDYRDVKSLGNIPIF